MLFLQGTRDQFARVDLITSVCSRLGSQATLHLVEDADHSFGIPKRSGRASESVIEELADTLATWARSHVTERAV